MVNAFFNVSRKSLVLTIALVFAFVVVYTPQEINHHRNYHTADAIFGLPSLLTIKETVLDPIAWTIAKSIVSMMVTDIVTWINNGFEGSPAFITDLDNFLLKAADQAVGQYIEELGGDLSFLCSPFKLDIQIALAIEYENIRANRPYQGCTLSGIVDNIEDFLDGTFDDNGWENWITITGNPEKYTPYGQRLAAEQELLNRIAESEDREKTQASWGSGFTSGKVCENVETPNGGTTLRCSIVKPGRMIADSLSKALGAGQDTLITADEISEIIGALIAQLATKALTGAAGLLGLSAGTGYTYSGYAGGSYTSAALAQGQGVGGAKGLSILQDSLTVQEQYKSLADTTVATMQAYSSNSKNPKEKRDTAQAYLNEARDIQLTAPNYIYELQGLISDYQNLETEYANAPTQTQRNAVLQGEQDIMNNFLSLNPYDASEYQAARTRWSIANL